MGESSLPHQGERKRTDSPPQRLFYQKGFFPPLAGQPKKGPYQFGAGAKHYTEKGASLAGFSNI